MSWRRACLPLAMIMAAITAGIGSGDARAFELPFGAKKVGQRISDAITELDVVGARRLFAENPGVAQRMPFQRARLAIYVGDCDSAEAILSTLDASRDVNRMSRLATQCAGAVAGSHIVEDKKNGIWIRFQDARDEVLMPYLVPVIAATRISLERDLGVVLPRPLRIDLVRDLFSLAAVSGLPVEAAETTGTVAVARWGRVTMITPRATPNGYPWEDTLAHEMTHLALSRGTRDHAPLWLQEGIAKRQEQRWREARPFDGGDAADRVAWNALQSGTSVGVDSLGPSIAMLDSADAAGIAFAEVKSFIAYWIERNGPAALQLFFADLRGLGRDEVNRALRSTSGYGLSQWILRWQLWLEKKYDTQPSADPELLVAAVTRPPGLIGRTPRQRYRLGELMYREGHFLSAVDEYALTAEDPTGLRYRAAQAQAATGIRGDELLATLGPQDALSGLHGGWFGLYGRGLFERGEPSQGARAWDLARSTHPYGDDVACLGYDRQAPAPSHWGPSLNDWRPLCAAARQIPR